MDIKERINNAISYTEVILNSNKKGGMKVTYLRRIISLLKDIKAEFIPSEQLQLDEKEATAEDAQDIFNT